MKCTFKRRSDAWELVTLPLKRTALLAKPMNGINAPKRPDCVARVVRLELEYPCASHVFEMS